MAVFLPRRWNRQPVGPVGIDPYWRSRGLRGSILPQPSGVLVDVARKGLGTGQAFSATPGPGLMSPQGLMRPFSTTAITATMPTTYGLGTSNVCILVGLNNNATSFDHGCCIKIGSATTGFGIGVGGNDWDSNGIGTLTVLGLYEAVRWITGAQLFNSLVPTYHNIGIIVNAAGVPATILDGVISATQAGTPMVTPAGNISYAGGYQANRYPLNDNLLYAHIFACAPTAGEIKALHQNPWQVYTHVTSKSYSLPEAAGDTNASIAATDSSDSAIISVANWRTAQIAATDASDTAALVGTPARIAQIIAADASDVAVVTAANWKTAQIVATDAADNAAIAGSAATQAAIAANEASDTSVIVATAIRTAQIAATEASDSAALATAVTAGAAIAATDGADSAALAAVAWRTAQIVAIDSTDTVQIIAEAVAGTASAAINASDSADTAVLATVVTTGAGIVATDGADSAALMVSVPAIAVADTGVRHGPLPPRRHFPQPILVRAHTAQAGQITLARATLSLVVVSARTRQAGQVTEAEMTLALEGQAMTTQAPSVRAFAWMRMVGSGKSWQAGQAGMLAANAAIDTKVMSGIFPRDPPPTYDGPTFEGLDPRYRNAA